MKLHHKALAGHTLSTSRGTVKVDADGHVESDDKELTDQLLVIGFKHVFRKKPEAPVEPEASAPEVAAEAPPAEPVPAPAPQQNQKHQHQQGKKGNR